MIRYFPARARLGASLRYPAGKLLISGNLVGTRRVLFLDAT
jgi:hypothetical protein